MPRVTVTRVRPELNKWIEYVQRPTHWVILTSHGREVAALVGMENLKFIWDQQDERAFGPINPKSCRPFGSEWVSRHFQGHYERDRDPEAHLHPSKAEAPWLGRPFEWPPKEASVPAKEAAVPAEGAEVPAPARPWWRPWRR
jgi:hypothetical protein